MFLSTKKTANRLTVSSFFVTLCCLKVILYSMSQLMLNFDFGEVAERVTKIRRRAFTQPKGDATIVSTKDRLDKRNRTIIARYYYWTEIKRRRFDDVMKILTDYEFFIGERTVQNILIDYDAYLKSLHAQHFTSRKLLRQFPGFSWT